MSTDMTEEILEIEWEKLVHIPVVPAHLSYPVYSETRIIQKCKLHIFVQGNLEEAEDKMIFMTVHDLGKNHQSFVDFVNSPPMKNIKQNSIFLHICLPGQEPNAENMNLDEEYPTMDQMGAALAQVLAKFKLTKCVAIGEGAGADICCRFAMDFHELVTGIVLIHCTSTTHGFVEHIKEILSNLTLSDGEMDQSAWNYLLTYYFGNHHRDQNQLDYIGQVKMRINPRNLSRLIQCFANREDFTAELNENLANVDAILVTGRKSTHNPNVQHMFEHMDKDKTALLVAEACVDVLIEAPEYVASAIILLCKRKGVLTKLELPDKFILSVPICPQQAK